MVKAAEGVPVVMQAGRLQNPRLIYPYENDRKDRKRGDAWRGCNHCGRHVPMDCQRIEWHGPPDQTVLYMHKYCFMKCYQRKYAEALYGSDVFAGAL
jgi:hypothetical protein